MNLCETENGIKIGDIVTVIEPTRYKQTDRSNSYLWLGSREMRLGKNMKVTNIKSPYLVVLVNGLSYDLDWIKPLNNIYDTISNKLAVL